MNTNTVDSAESIESTGVESVKPTNAESTEPPRRPTPCDRYDCIWCHKGQSGCSGQCLCPRKPRYSIIDDQCGAFRRRTRDNIKDTVTMMIPIGEDVHLIEWRNIGKTKATIPTYYDYTIVGYYDRYALVTEIGKAKKTTVDYFRLLNHLKLKPGEPIVGNVTLRDYQTQQNADTPQEARPHVEEQLSIFDLVAEDVVLLEKIGLGPKKDKK